MVASDLLEPDDTDPAVNHRYSFEDFELWPKRRELIRGETQIPIGGRALDLLIALVERAGRVVSKTELFALVWPNMVVEESNLRVHIAAVRSSSPAFRDGVIRSSRMPFAPHIERKAHRGRRTRQPIKRIFPQP